MIRFLGKLPKKCIVAFSGGVDSVAVTDFLVNGGKEIDLAFFHHGTAASEEAEIFVREFSKLRKLHLNVKRIDKLVPPRGISQEEHWRNCRYEFLESFTLPVVTCHHLDDAVETWIFSSLHGESKLIPYSRQNIIRPFLISEKKDLISWANKRSLRWQEDISNTDLKYTRNLIRHAIVPQALKVNPGLRKVLKKKYLNSILGVQ
jgi:tRNA(Ile)-lysidine synthase